MASHIFHNDKPVPHPLFVLTMISNPVRYQRRYRLYKEFEEYVTQSGAILYTAEVALGDREFEITQAGNPRHLQLRSQHEYWHKENALNLLAARLPSDWKYVAWIDADIRFTDPHWVNECLHYLQRHRVIQMFSHAFHLGPDNEPLFAYKGDTGNKSFAYCFKNKLPKNHGGKPFDFWHPKSGVLAREG